MNDLILELLRNENGVTLMLRKAITNLMEGIQFEIEVEKEQAQGGLVQGFFHVSCGKKPLRGMMLEISLCEYRQQEEKVLETIVLEKQARVAADSDQSWPFSFQLPHNAVLTFTPTHDLNVRKAQGYLLRLGMQRPFPKLDIRLKEVLQINVAPEIAGLIAGNQAMGMKMLKEPEWDREKDAVSFEMGPPEGFETELKKVTFLLQQTEEGLVGDCTFSASNKRLSDYLKTAVGKRKLVTQTCEFSGKELALEDGRPNLSLIRENMGLNRLDEVIQGIHSGKLSLSDGVDAMEGDGEVGKIEG